MEQDIRSLRAQLKAKPIASLRKQMEQEDAAFGFTGGIDRLKLEDGKTLKIRIFPARPGEDSFSASRKVYWLDLNGDNGSYRGTVLDARHHGGMKMDLVDEYVKFAKKLHVNDPARIAPMTATGMTAKNLLPTSSWVVYAGIVPGPGVDSEICRPQVWEFKKMVRDQINRLAMTEDPDEPIEVDPFTDVDEGLPILVKFNKKPKKGEDYYEVSLPQKPKAYPLSDEELELFVAQKPLAEIAGVSTVRDFERALEGLQNFDEEHELGLFEDQEWLDLVEEVRAQYGAAEEEAPAKKAPKAAVKPAPRVAKPAPVEEPEEYEPEPGDEPEEAQPDPRDKFDPMDRSELKAFIKENGIDFTVYKNTEDDAIRDAIRAALKTAPAEEPEDEPEEDDEPEAPVPAKPEPPKASTGARLTVKDIQARLAATKK